MPLDPSVGDLTTEVSEAVGAMNSATVLINGIAARVQAAVDAALANGVSPEAIAVLTQLKSDLDVAGTDLANAVAANP